MDAITRFWMIMGISYQWRIRRVDVTLQQGLLVPFTLVSSQEILCTSSIPLTVYIGSRVPIEIKDKSSRSWNDKRVFISKDGPMEVAEAYLAQFQKDFSSFLVARAQEIVKGGCMFIYLSGRDTGDPRDQGASGVIGDTLEAAFNDMVAQGLIEVEKLYSFNLPFFAPCVEEVIAEFEKEGSFIVKRVLFLSGVVEKANRQGYMNIENMDKCQSFGKMIAKQFRAILEGLITSHFGGEIVESLFERFAVRAAENISKLWKSNIEGGGILAVVERA